MSRVQLLTDLAERYIQNGGPVQLDLLNLESNGTGLLNLSATVTPSNFAKHFGQLFNTWVALGYCPQCSPEIVVGNGTIIPAGLRQRYRQTTSTLSRPGPPQIIVNWAWEAVILALGLILLVTGIIALVFEYGQSVIPSFSCCGRRRQTRKPGIDQDSMMRMLLSSANTAAPTERYPMPRRPMTNGPAAVIDNTKSLGRRISARLSRMSGASFMLPIQGARLPQHRQSATANAAGVAAEAPDRDSHRLSSAEFFARRYSNIPEERYPPPRRRSVSANPQQRRKEIPSLRYSLFRNSWMPAARNGFEKMREQEERDGAWAWAFAFGDGGGEASSWKKKRREEEGEGEGGQSNNNRMLSVRYSHVPPFRYRAPQLGGSGQQRQEQMAAPASPEKSSEGTSWIYDEYMTNKL